LKKLILKMLSLFGVFLKPSMPGWHIAVALCSDSRATAQPRNGGGRN